ncbi:MAG: phospho-sugar mutase [Eggerthellaceae bacterium]|nr:phospho-sugar mutase [Eggerthellaceae bacterium]
MTRETELLDLWLNNVKEEDLLAELEAMRSDEKAAIEAFHKDLAFGTAGLRGIIGAGTDRMNVHTVGRATQGFADYLNANFENPSVAIGRDSRIKGEEFVRRTAEVFAANGIKTYVYPRIEPTPCVSWAVRDLSCSGGVCMTASHNPAPYNGYKAYGPDGCQIATEAADAISAAIANVDTFKDVKILDFDEAIEKGLVEWIEEAVLDRFIDAVEACSVARPQDEGLPLKLVYTPLNGTGLECVSRILERVGVTDVTVVPEQAEPDGNFPTCPYPNPEIREALQKGIDLCEVVHPDLLVATDPDADRMGIAVKDGDDYLLLTGNETGVLLLDYCARMVGDTQGAEALKRKVAVTTIVSSVMVDAVAAQYGFEVRRVLTGFKYIGGIIGELEAEGEADRYLFGFEESYGYLNGTHVRDKDAVDASMLVCQMAQYYKAQGMNLADAMRALYEKHGYFLNKTLSFSFPGVEGGERMTALMKGLREEPPAAFAGCAVEGCIDYATGVNGLPAANVVEFDLEGGNKVIFRPSGTEPKVKAYLFSKRETREAAEQLLADLEAEVSELMQ